MTLKEKLEAKLPGIAVRCVSAYQRLCARGEFIQPASGEGLDANVIMESHPFYAMAQDCFIPDFAGEVSGRLVALSVAQAWLDAIGRKDESRKLRANNIVEKLRGVSGFEHVDEGPRPKGKPRPLLGLRIRPQGQRKLRNE